MNPSTMERGVDNGIEDFRVISIRNTVTVAPTIPVLRK